jgi:hypothetical protein
MWREVDDQGSCVMDQPESAHVGFARGSGDGEERRARERRSSEVSVGGLRVEETGGRGRG